MFRIRGHHLHLPHLTFDDSKNLRLLYGIRVIRDLVNKIAEFFLPVFLYLVGSTSEQLSFLPFNEFQRGMLTLSSYYLVLGIVSFFLVVPLGKVCKEIGYQRSFLLSFLIRSLYFVSVFYVASDVRFLLVAVIFSAINMQLFWPGYHAILSRSASREKMGSDLGILRFLLQVVAVISPAISGVIAYRVGIEYLFLFGVVLMLFSGIFAIRMDEEKFRGEPSYKEFFNWLKESRFAQLSASFAGRYIYDISIYIWPLYIFLILGAIDVVGYLYTTSLFLAMSFTFFTSYYIDHSKSKRPFKISGGILSIITILRSQIVTPLSIVLVDTLDRMVSNVYSLFFDVAFMKRGQGSTADSFFIYREMVLWIASIIFWLLFGLFFLFFSGWQALYILAGIGVLVGLMVKDSKYD
jgi:MFS family permease